MNRYDELIWRVKYHAQEVAKKKTKNKVYYGQSNYDIVKRQSYMGKMGEWSVYYYLKLVGHKPLNPPLMSVLDYGDWSADLRTDKYKIAVKTCPSWWMGKIYAYNWTFQQGAKSGRKDKEILKSEREDYIVFFVAAHSYTAFEIYGVANTKRLKQSGAYIFEDGIDMAKYKGEKLYVKANKTDAIKPIRMIARFEEQR